MIIVTLILRTQEEKPKGCKRNCGEKTQKW